MKIAIIGSGIGGLAAYHALRKYVGDRAEIQLYESHRAPSDGEDITIGAGLGLAPNGIRALESISSPAAEFVQSRGYTHTHLTFRNSSGALLGHFPTGSAERYGYAQRFIPREDVHRALRINVPETAIQWNKKLATIETRTEDMRLVFEDGSDTVVDLVIGADGAKSAAARFVYGEDERPQYSSLTNIGGFIPIADLPAKLQQGLDIDGVTMTFGLSGFFGCARSDMNKTNVMWWSKFDAPNGIDRDIPLAEFRERLMNRHRGWETPYDDEPGSAYASIIESACQSNAKYPLLVIPRYFQTKLPSRWGPPSGRIILIGDAAHTLPSESGQGVSCAIEDAAAYAQLLAFYLPHSPEPFKAYKNSINAYESVRRPRLERVLAAALRSQQKKDLTPWGGWFRDKMMGVLCTFGHKINDKNFSYNVDTEVRAYLDGVVPPLESTS